MEALNQNQIVLVSLNDLTTLMERTFTKCMEENSRENLADKQELKPLSYWLAKKNLDRTTVWRWEQDGKIKLTRIGRKIYASEETFSNFGKEG
jgi:hypothetical protein